jgi:uncharacterized damage-inducible protein DinB
MRVAENPTVGTFYQSWGEYQDGLIEALAPLTPEQLELRAAPHLRSVGDIARHVIGARARWMHGLMGEGGPEMAELATLDRSETAGRTADELVQGMNATWQVMQECLGRWTSEDMAHIFAGDWNGEAYSLSRAWIIWHLIEHDLHHGGELSFTLGMHGLAAPDL